MQPNDTGTKIEEKIFDLVYELALRDAVSQKAYAGEKKHLYKAKKPRKLARDYIDGILHGKRPEFYDVAHKIEKAFDDNKFTFGNAQKLINMIAKYMYIAYYQSEDKAALREKFRGCHCPMDRIMIDKVISKLKEMLINKDDVEKIEQFTKPAKGYIVKDENGIEKTVKWTTFLKQPWSKMQDGSEQYKLFQSIVKYLSERENIIPVEYDYLIWESK